MAKIHIAACCYGPPYWPFVDSVYLGSAQAPSVVQVASRAGHEISGRRWTGDSLISRARCNAASWFVSETDADYLFSVDQDTAYPADALLKLLDARADIVGGIYRIKDDSRTTVAVRMNGDTAQERAKAHINALNTQEICNVAGIGTGCMLVKRQVFEKMAAVLPKYDWQSADGRRRVGWTFYMPVVHCWPDGIAELLGEDWSFCRKAICEGFEVNAHFGVRCDHYGMKRFGWDNAPENTVAP